MARTTPGRENLEVDLPGQAVILKLLQGFGISLSATGADAGTGDVTASVNQADLDTIYQHGNYMINGSLADPELVFGDDGDLVLAN